MHALDGRPARNRTGFDVDPLDRPSMDEVLEALVPGMPVRPGG